MLLKIMVVYVLIFTIKVDDTIDLYRKTKEYGI